MKRSEASRYARWSAAVALTLAAATACVYLQRSWKARIERNNAPVAAAANVSRQSNGVTFSKGEGSRKEFTVEASKSTDFKDRHLTELEAVVITIFGKNGDRHDVIHTRSCQYGQIDGNVVCSGEVRMDLESAADAARAVHSPADAAPQVLHVVTSAVTFNQKSGLAVTSESVSFSFPNGSGQGVGMEYKSEAGTVKLLKNVLLNLRPSPSPSGPAKRQTKATQKNQPGAAADAASPENVVVTGSSLDFARTERLMHILGPAVAESKTTRLTAAELTLNMDAQFRAQTLLASGEVHGEQPKVVSRGNGQMDVSGDRLTAEFSPQGWVTTVEAEGHVKGARQAVAEHDDATAEHATIAMWPRVNEMKELNLRGDVVLKTLASATGDGRLLRTEAFRMEFSQSTDAEAGKAVKAETLAAGRMEWSEANATSIAGFSSAKKNSAANKSGDLKAAGTAHAPANSPAHTTLAADKLHMLFDGLGKPKQLLADGHVRTERTMPEKPTRTATAQSGVANLLPTGGWSQMDLHGAVKLREGDRNGQSDHAVFRQVEQTATLTGRALVRDATTETAAARIVFVQNTGDIHAEGGVRSTDLPGPNGPGNYGPGNYGPGNYGPGNYGPGNYGSGSNAVVQLAPAPTHVTSEQLDGNSQTGRALYTGHARMWQGESVLEADSIELLRETRVMNALGNIRAVFPQAAATTPGASPAGAANVAAGNTAPASSVTPAAKTVSTSSAGSNAQKKSPLWHVTAQSLMYSDAESHAHLEHDVIAVSADQKMRAPIVDLYFTRGVSTAGGATPGATGVATGTPGGTSAGAPPNGPQQISKAIGNGGTTVEEDGRKAVAERGVYTASDGKFVMSGGDPTLYDGAEGNTHGRQLTFFLADDTIIVDSENGSRIVTHHRVEK
jgi:lipopolysaccharide export system protein LptA